MKWGCNKHFYLIYRLIKVELNIDEDNLDYWIVNIINKIIPNYLIEEPNNEEYKRLLELSEILLRDYNCITWKEAKKSYENLEEYRNEFRELLWKVLFNLWK